MRTVIKNGTLVTASDITPADLWMEEGHISAVVPHGAGSFGKADREIDARGKYVIPGGIDVHTHLDMPFGGTMTIDDFESGSQAAACGGTTALVDFATQSKGQALRQGLDAWHAKAEGKTAIDYGFHMIITDVSKGVLEEMKNVVAEGVTSFKLFMAYPNVLQLDDASIFRAMQHAGEVGALTCMHAETGDPIDVLVKRALAAGQTAPIYHALTRPEAAEASATERTVALSEIAKVPVYIVHLTCERALQQVMAARSRGLPVYAETCPQYLFLNEDDLRGTKEDPFLGARYVCSPPLRPAHHQAHLWRGLREHDLQVVSTDHCSFNMKGQKDMGRHDFSKIPNGMPSIETRMHLIYDGVTKGLLSLNRFVEVTSTAPAKLFGLYPKKGTLAPGADGDVVVWDPKKPLRLDQKNLNMRADYSPYEGRTVAGSPAQVFSRGELVAENGRFVGKRGHGRFVKRATFGA